MSLVGVPGCVVWRVFLSVTTTYRPDPVNPEIVDALPVGTLSSHPYPVKETRSARELP